MKDVKVYQVGGSVRDTFLQRKCKDYDYAIEAESYDHMKEFIISQGAEIFLEKPEYFTIRAKWCPPGFDKPIACDFTLCRKESSYSDFRHPDNVEPGTILEDLSRRDFTMNAIAFDIFNKKIIDPYNGRLDISRKKIVTVGNAVDRFNEDALRILRALRFSIQLDFGIESLTSMAIYDLKVLLKHLSPERIRDELYKMFSHDTNKTILQIIIYKLSDYVFNEKTGIWLKPTMEKK